MKKLLYALLILNFVSCTNSSNKKSDETKSKTKDSLKKEQIVENNEFKELDNSNYELPSLIYDGKIVTKRIWQDSNSDNIALFTQKENELFVYHFVSNSDSIKLLRRIYDFEEDCDFDLTLEFIENSIGITDLDNNNFGEITFAYKKACISDVSPKDLKLIMLENGNKFIIRGQTLVDLGDVKIGGDKNIDPSFENAPDNFLPHANKLWASINK